MRNIRIAIALLFLALPAAAQELPAKPEPKFPLRSQNGAAPAKQRAADRLIFGRDPELPKWAKISYGVLAAGVHASIERDVRSTLRARAVCPECSEANPLARPFYNSGNLRPVAHAGGAAVNLTALALLRSKKFSGGAFLLQAAVIIGTNVAANRNNRLVERRR